MANLETSIRIRIDKKEGETHLAAFRQAFDEAMRGMGKSAAEIDAFGQLAADIEAGKVKVDELDTETKELATTWQKLAHEAADKDLLGLAHQQAAQREIHETRDAFEQLAQTETQAGKAIRTDSADTAAALDGMADKSRDLAASFRDAKGAFLTLGASAAGLTAAAGRAIEFESAMADVAKVVDGSEEQIAALGSRIKELSGTIPLASGELAQIAAAGGQLGVPIEKLETFIELAAQMSTAFGMSADEAGQAVAKLSNVFALPLEKVGELGDAINVLGNTTAAREADIVNVLTRIGGTARQFGLTAEQAAALGASMLSLGVSSDVAGTGINALLSKLQTANVQGADFQNALLQMGVSAEQLAADIRANPQQALTEFLRNLDQLDQASRAEILSRLFGTEYQDDIARLLGGLEGYEAALGRVSDKAQTAGAMQREFATRMETTEEQLKLLKNGIENIAINLGSIFLPAIRAAASVLGDVAQGIAAVVEKNPAIAGTVSVLGTLLASTSALKAVFLALRVVGVKSLTDIAATVKGLFTPLGALAAQSSKTAVAMRAAGHMAMAGWIGWNIGTALREQFLEVELAGIDLAEGLTKIVARAQFAWEAMKAPFTDDTIEDATRRLESELANIEQTYGEIAQAAIEARNKQTAAADDAAAAAAQTGEAAAEAGAQAEAGMQGAAGAAQRLAVALTGTAAAGKGAADTIATAFGSLDLGSADAVKALDTALAKIGDRAQETGQALTAFFAQADGGKLAQFQNQLAAAFDTGSISAERFAQLNDSVLAASFRRLGLNADEALGRIRPAASDAIAAFQLLADSLAGAPDSAEAKARALAQAGGEIAASFKSRAELDQFRAAVEGLADAQKITAEQAAQLRTAIDDQQTALERAAAAPSNLARAYETLGITASTELVRIAGEQKRAFDTLREARAPLADVQTGFMAYAKTAIEAHHGVADAALVAQAESLGLKDAVLQLEQSALTSSAAYLQLQNRMEQLTDTARREGETLTRNAEAATQAARTALELAKAKGDENEIRRASIAMYEAEVQQAQAVAQAKVLEANAAAEKVNMLTLELTADGQLTEAERQLIAEAQRVADVKRDEAVAAQQAAKAKEADTDASNKTAAAHDKAASAAESSAGAQVISWQNIARAGRITADELNQYADAIQGAWMRTKDLITSKSLYFNAQGVGQKIQDEMRAAIAMAKSVDNAIASLQSGHATLRDLQQSAGIARDAVGKVGDERLNALRSALQDAQNRMRELSDTARDALGSVRDELDQLRGNTEALEKRRGEEKLRELQAQLKEAQAQGNTQAVSDLSEAIRLQRELNAEKLKAAREEKAERNRDTRNTGSASAGSASGGGVQTVRTVNVNLGGRTVRVLEGDDDNLLAALEAAQRKG